MIQEEKTRAEVNLSLIKFTIEEKNSTSEWLEDAIDTLQTLSFLHKFKGQKKDEAFIDYIGSKDHHDIVNTINSSKLKLIQLISNII